MAGVRTLSTVTGCNLVLHSVPPFPSGAGAVGLYSWAGRSLHKCTQPVLCAPWGCVYPGAGLFYAAKGPGSMNGGPTLDVCAVHELLSLLLGTPHSPVTCVPRGLPPLHRDEPLSSSLLRCSRLRAPQPSGSASPLQIPPARACQATLGKGRRRGLRGQGLAMVSTVRSAPHTPVLTPGDGR